MCNNVTCIRYVPILTIPQSMNKGLLAFKFRVQDQVIGKRVSVLVPILTPFSSQLIVNLPVLSANFRVRGAFARVE